jgi:hypothetical protein
VRCSGSGSVVVGAGATASRFPQPLPRLPLHEQFVHVLGFEQARDPDELLLLGRARLGELAELLAVEDDAVEVREREIA